jgi:transposase
VTLCREISRSFVKTAASRPIERGMAGSGLLAHVLVATTTVMPTKTHCLFLSFATLLAACGGGARLSSTPTPEPEATASLSETAQLGALIFKVASSSFYCSVQASVRT